MASEIVDGHHVVRHCKGRLIERDDANGIREMFPVALELREGEKYLSASYYEFFTGSHKERIALALASLRRRYTPKNGDGLVMMNAGVIRQCGAVHQTKVRVLHEGKVGKEDYAAIRGIPSKYNAELSALLATTAVRDIVFVAECDAQQNI